MLDSIWSFFNLATLSTSAEGTLIISSAAGRYVTWGLIFLLVSPFSFVLWRRKATFSIPAALFFTSLVIPLIILPGLAIEKVEISKSEMKFITGLWFAPTVRTISLTEIASIEEREIRVRQRILPRKDLFWIFRRKDGKQVRMKLSDLFSVHRESVSSYLDSNGVGFSTYSSRKVK